MSYEKISRQKLLERFQDFDSAQRKVQCLFYGILALLGIIVCGLSLYVAALGAKGYTPSPWWAAMLIVFFLPVLPLTLWRKRNLQKFGLMCPACSKYLGRSLVLTTGRCPHCGNQVLEMDGEAPPHLVRTKGGHMVAVAARQAEAESAAGPSLSVQVSGSGDVISKREYLARYEAFSREGTRYGMFFGSSILLCFLVAWVSALYLDRNVPKGSPANMIWAACFLIFIVVLLAVAVWLNNRSLTRRKMRCPSCSKPLVHSLIQTTGRCGFCGHHVVELDDTASNDG
jgi:uncharacterized CHY-type Zn-finger protein